MNIPENIPVTTGSVETPAENSNRRVFLIPVLFVVVLWVIEALESYFRMRPIFLGITPRTPGGLIGILTSPFIHAGVDHLLSNSLPLIVVGIGMLYFYASIARKVITWIWLMTGFWVWLAARPEPHIGASGLIYGFVVFLFFSGLLRKDTRLMAISMLVTFLYGSMVWGILPVDQSVSWESHLFGSIAGLFTAVYFRKEGPQRPKPQWEIDEAAEPGDEPVYGPFEDPSRQSIDSNQPLKISYDFVEEEKKSDRQKDSGLS
ncbi:MAG TPA: rhomboid family intramembrane serine protease [Bacteroidia bacterium]|nr:rhomboid family intramembrane serine protease [Bacteroidia bacterium]